MKRKQLLKIISHFLLLSTSVFFFGSCGDMLADDDQIEDLLQRYGHEYEVWGDDGVGPPPSDCFEPYSYGYKYIGTGYNSQYFSDGIHSYYVILTKPGNFAFIDAVSDASGDFQSSYASCNTRNEGKVSESYSEPDDSFAWVGTEHARDQLGLLVINIPFSSSIDVYVSDHAYYWDD